MEGFFRFGSPFLQIDVEGKEVEALLDTGFNGHLMLPQIIIDELALDQIGISDYITASGGRNLTKVYKGKVMFLDEHVDIPILSTEAKIVLAGFALFKNCRIVIDMKKELLEISKSI